MRTIKSVSALNLEAFLHQWWSKNASCFMTKYHQKSRYVTNFLDVWGRDGCGAYIPAKGT
jgi:hypothetical protein